MKKYLILDTEKTYNFGWVILNEKGEKEIEKQYVISDNFNNRLICGESTYTRKKKYFDNDKNIKYGNPKDCLLSLYHDLLNNNITIIIGHNVSEDRNQVGNLIQQVLPFCLDTEKDLIKKCFDNILYFDSQKIIKALLPQNHYLSIKDTMEDLTGLSYKQSHTALADCLCLSDILIPTIKYFDIFLLNDNLIWDNEITQAVIKTYNNCFNFVSSADAFAKISTTTFTIKAFNNKCDTFVNYNLMDYCERPKIGKNGNVLKTTEKCYKLTDKGKNIFYLYHEFKTILWKEKLTSIFETQYINNDEELLFFKNKIEEQLKTQYKIKEEQLKTQYKIKEEQLKTQYNRKQNDLSFSKQQYENEKQKLDNILANIDAKIITRFYLNFTNKKYKKEIKQLLKDLKRRNISVEEMCQKIYYLEEYEI